MTAPAFAVELHRPLDLDRPLRARVGDAAVAFEAGHLVGRLEPRTDHWRSKISRHCRPEEPDRFQPGNARKTIVTDQPAWFRQRE